MPKIKKNKVKFQRKLQSRGMTPYFCCRASCGWIRDYERGGYDILNGKRVNRSTKYKLSEEKLSEEEIREVLKKII